LHPGYELTNEGQANSFLIKFNSNGDLLWYKQIGGPGMSRITAMRFDDHNGIVIGGTFDTTAFFYDLIHPFALNSAGKEDVFLAHLDSNGNYDWVERVGGI
jgi:hypothetical protein